jgi:hypothetical protein
VEQGEKLSRVPLHWIRTPNSDTRLGRAAFGEILKLPWRNYTRVEFYVNIGRAT